MKPLILLLLLTISFTLKAQIADSFTDGDFTHDPAWSGDTSMFKISSSTAIPAAMRPALQLNDSLAGNSYIVAPNPMVLNVNEWDFWIKLSLNPTSNNNARVYIVSDRSNLKDTLNGYYVGIGETADRITFCKQTGLTITTLFTGTFANLNKTTNPLRIKVERDINALWKVYSDTTGGTDFMLEGSATDNTFSTCSYFGLNCLYTASNATKFYFDDVYAGSIVVDTIAPTVVSLSVISSSQLDILFSEPLDKPTAETIMNYNVNNGINYPATALQDTSNKALVHLSFATLFPPGLLDTIIIINLKDINNNSITKITLSFIYSYFIDTSVNKIRINEIMADVNPAPNQLPACDYVELYNRSAADVNLNHWALKLKLAGDTFYFGNITLQPDSFLVICDNSSVAQLSAYCSKIISFTSFTINDESTITIYNSALNVEDQLTYDLSWYHDAVKSQGAWSLEQVDPDNPCSAINNWKASVDISGGTPGRKNSVDAVNLDIMPPKIDKICVTDSNGIKIYFNETMNKAKLLNIAAYHIEPLLNIDSVINDVSDLNCIDLKFSNPISTAQIYTLNITDSLTDCAGNVLSFSTVSRFAYPEIPNVNDIIINEILFNPKPDGIDFVEIYNRSTKNISLSALLLSTYDTYLNALKYAYPVSSACDMIFKGEYLALTTNPTIVKQQYNTRSPDNFITMTSIPAFNNDAGIVVLAKTDSTIIDRLDYSATMHFPLLLNVEGVSLERINPEKTTQDKTNWHSASEQSGFATPAFRNSQYTDFLYLEDPFTIYPEIFSPDNDGRDDVLQINYKFTSPGLTANVLIFDSKGRLIKDLIKNVLMGTTGTFLWDGINDNNAKAIVGIYIIYIEVFDMTGNVAHYKKTAVLGGKL